MKKVINVKLDPKSVADAITELQMYKEDVERRVKLIVETLVKNGANIARAKLQSYDAIYSGKLLGDINGYMDGSVGIVRVNNEYAVYVEFGTGPVGKKHPHPSDINVSYRNKPWYTKADGKPMDMIYGWTPHENEDGEVYYIAYGQPAKPFMYETAQQLREEVVRVAKEVFG